MLAGNYYDQVYRICACLAWVHSVAGSMHMHTCIIMYLKWCFEMVDRLWCQHSWSHAHAAAPTRTWQVGGVRGGVAAERDGDGPPRRET